MNKSPFLLAPAVLLLAGTALAADPPVQEVQTDMGMVLADENGMTLYTYDRDEPGVSNCVDTCIQNWPALTADDDATPQGDFSVIDRPDDGRQWAYRDRPLYLWVKDEKPGDTTGHGVGGVWQAAQP